MVYGDGNDRINRKMSCFVEEIGVHVDDMSRITEEDLIDSSPRQCILYYSNPNFSLDAESMSLQMPADDKIEDDDDDDDDDDDEDDEDDIEDEEESNSGDNDCDENCRHHPNGCHRHHRELDINEELERTEFESQIDLDTECYVDCYEHDACQSANVLSMYRHQRPSQHRLLGKGHVRWFLSSAVQSCKLCCHSKPCLFLTYVILILVLLSSFVSLVLVSVLIVEPYYRVVNFANVTCRAYEVNFGSQEQSCSCGKGCSSKYLCIKIQVEYFDAKVEPILATLYEDEASLNRQCSFYPPCRSSRIENEEAVLTYRHLFGQVGQQFDCWANPDKKTEVIQHKRFQYYHVTNGVGWSMFLFLVSLAFLFYILYRKGCFRS